MSCLPHTIAFALDGHIRTMANAVKKGVEAAGGSATLFQVPETLPEPGRCKIDDMIIDP